MVKDDEVCDAEECVSVQLCDLFLVHMLKDSVQGQEIHIRNKRKDRDRLWSDRGRKLEKERKKRRKAVRQSDRN